MVNRDPTGHQVSLSKKSDAFRISSLRLDFGLFSLLVLSEFTLQGFIEKQLKGWIPEREKGKVEKQVLTLNEDNTLL